MSITSQIVRLHEIIPKHVTIVVASKGHSVEAITEAYSTGQRIFAESYIQELLEKQAVLPKDIEWHMIGHLQTNKIKYIAPFVSMVQSVDSERVLDGLNRHALKCNRVIDCLLEIHVSSDENKTGWEIEELRKYINGNVMPTLKNVRIRGIMGMATNTNDVDIMRQDFETLKAIFDEFQPIFGKDFDTLSMGMSSDFQYAVEAGATMVRIGSLIFGERTYRK